ncbi:MAG: hypothetical protein JWQ38_142 [Flavipsychrobacter sp.]|nr:hypothetical protein [Flavipsychrobacter sp.]
MCAECPEKIGEKINWFTPLFFYFWIMMNRTAGILFLSLMMTGLHLSGQQKVSGKQAAKAPAKAFVPPVYIGESDYKGGPIQPSRFSTLLRQGLTSYDSLGNHYKIVGFDFSYAERKVYEDSVGTLMKITDFMSEHYMGNMIGADLGTDADTSSDKEVILSLYQRVKPGDTVYFDHIMLNKIGSNPLFNVPDSVAIAGKGIKCIIVK